MSDLEEAILAVEPWVKALDVPHFRTVLTAAGAWQKLMEEAGLILPEEAQAIIDQYEANAVGNLGTFRYSSARIIGAYALSKALVKAVETFHVKQRGVGE